LSLRFAVLIIVVLSAAAIVYLLWNWYLQANDTYDKALAEARTLAVEIMAAWDYIDTVQDDINYNNDGTYDFKDVYCSIAGKSIARRFMASSDGYIIRFVRDSPRSGGDKPDDFETKALLVFNEGTTEFYGIDRIDEKRVFRYTKRLDIRAGCLSCHGDPAGEKDETGFLKEGMRLGDIAGAVSVVIPLDLYERDAQTRMLLTVFFFLALMSAVVLIAQYALRRWVTSPLAQSNAQLAVENEAKTNYLAAMSHEMRTPLTSIIAFTDLWEKNVKDGDDDNQNMVCEIRENSRVLLDMVNNTIDVAHLDSGRLTLLIDEVDMVDVINSSVHTVLPLAIKQGITLEKEIQPNVPIVFSDWDVLRKIVVNLLVNAIKYTQKGGTVLVAVSYDDAADKARALTVSITDTGIGIAKADIGRIFDKYVQVGEQPKTGVSGSGLGLFLVQGFVEELGGNIEVQSKPGEGSRFTVTLPVSAEAQSE
jgi:signal transduction histidine kinase